jgi:uncharacterized protein (TIGR00296 family)
MRVAAAPQPRLQEDLEEQEEQQPVPDANANADPTVAAVHHCRFAFSTLAAHLCDKPLPAPHAFFGEAHCALFVTWNKLAGSRASHAPTTGGGGGKGDGDAHHHHYHLRGCIGTLEPRPLRAALRDYTLTSALRDHRFDPITAREVPHLKVTVSLLRLFERAAHPEDWAVGQHGIIVAFRDPALERALGGGGSGRSSGSGRRSATFLPEVAQEQGWSQRQAVEAAVRKAGYSGVVNADLLASVEVTRYQSTRWELSYDEWRRWAGAGWSKVDGGGAAGGGQEGATLAAALEQQQQHHHHHHGSGAILRALRRLVRGRSVEDEEEEEDEEE